MSVHAAASHAAIPRAARRNANSVELRRGVEEPVIMVIASRLASVLIVLAALILPRAALGGVEAPPTPAQVVERYSNAVQGLLGRCHDMFGRVATGAVGVIGRLDEAGAPNEAIIRAGAAGLNRVHRTAETCFANLRRLTEGAVRVLRRLEAPEEAFQAVHRIADEAAGVIRGHAERAAAAIREAVANATAEGTGNGA